MQHHFTRISFQVRAWRMNVHGKIKLSLRFAIVTRLPLLYCQQMPCVYGLMAGTAVLPADAMRLWSHGRHCCAASRCHAFMVSWPAPLCCQQMPCVYGLMAGTAVLPADAMRLWSHGQHC